MRTQKIFFILFVSLVLSFQSAFAGRYYDAKIGRFVQIDPKAQKFPTWSPYNYAVNNPLVNIDPDGKTAVSIQAGVRFMFSVTGSLSFGLVADHQGGIGFYRSVSLGGGVGIGAAGGVSAMVYPAASSINDITGTGITGGGFVGLGAGYLEAEGNVSFQSNDYRLGVTAGIPGLGGGAGVGAFGEVTYTSMLGQTSLKDILKNSESFLSSNVATFLKEKLGLSNEQLIAKLSEMVKAAQEVEAEKQRLAEEQKKKEEQEKEQKKTE